MKERLLVLAKAAPEASKKYQELICIAGITDKGEWRRIYPVPWEIFWGSRKTKFKKKTWIEYELEGSNSSDHRPESRKIKCNTIKVLKGESFSNIEKMLLKRITTIKSLEKRGHITVSLGVIKPEIIDFQPMDNKKYEKVLGMGKQKTLFGKKAYRLEPPEYKSQYIFIDETGEKPHKMLCEDWEIERLYSSCKKYFKEGKYKSMDEVHEKVKDKMLNKITQYGHTYFIVGTHYRFNTYDIVGVIYPKKGDVS